MNNFYNKCLTKANFSGSMHTKVVLNYHIRKDYALKKLCLRHIFFFSILNLLYPQIMFRLKISLNGGAGIKQWHNTNTSYHATSAFMKLFCVSATSSKSDYMSKKCQNVLNTESL